MDSKEKTSTGYVRVGRSTNQPLYYAAATSIS